MLRRSPRLRRRRSSPDVTGTDPDNTQRNSSEEGEGGGYFALDLSRIPDDLVHAGADTSKWLGRAVYSPTPFPPGSMGQKTLPPLPLYPLQLERVLALTTYFAFNVCPLGIVGNLALWLTHGARWAWVLAVALTCYLTLTYAAWTVICRLQGWHFSMGDVLKNEGTRTAEEERQDALQRQFSFTSRNSEKYHAAQWVWPALLHPLPPSPTSSDSAKPVAPCAPPTATVYCIVPHAVLPIGCVSYAFFSSLFSPRFCRFTAAPVLFRLPFIGPGLRKIGIIPARAARIAQALEAGDDVGVVLDGIAGMFQHAGSDRERAYVLSRKAIAAIALKVGACRLVPVYGFGHTDMWSMLPDPFGLLARLSIALNVSVLGFVGRWGWPFGGPRRVKLLMAFGEPIDIPANPNKSKPTPEMVDAMHAKLVNGFRKTFDTHKAAYGWGHKQLEFV